MYVCVCNAITSSDIERDPTLITSCGTKCGRCIPYVQSNCYAGTDIEIFTHEQLVALYEKSIVTEEKS
jgi:hypothetical protein